MTSWSVGQNDTLICKGNETHSPKKHCFCVVPIKNCCWDICKEVWGAKILNEASDNQFATILNFSDRVIYEIDTTKSGLYTSYFTSAYGSLEGSILTIKDTITSPDTIISPRTIAFSNTDSLNLWFELIFKNLYRPTWVDYEGKLSAYTLTIVNSSMGKLSQEQAALILYPAPNTNDD